MIQFLDIIIDTNTRSILKHGKLIKTSALNFDLLVYFAKHPNKIISRSELMDNVWEGKIVSDSTVYKQVNRLKKEILTHISEYELIQTVHGKGFMFSWDNQLINTSNDVDISGNQENLPKGSYTIWWVISLIVSVIAFSLFQINSIKLNNQKLARKVERLAIIYQVDDNTTSGISQKAMAQVLQSQLLMSDYLNTRLEKTQVKSNSFQQNTTTLIQDFGYDHVLNMQLISHEQGVKAHVYLRKEGNLVPMQIFEANSLFKLVNEISNWLLQEIQSDDSAHASLNMTESEGAFEDYITGVRYNLQNQTDDAIEVFQSAVRKDPQFWVAWNALAVMKRNKGQINEAIEILDNIDLSQASNRLTFLVNNTRAGCYYRLGQLNKAVASFEQALVPARKIQDPVFMVTALVNQSYMYSDLDQVEKARQNLEEALLNVNKEQQKTQLGAIYSSLTSIYKNNIYDIVKALRYSEQSYETFKLAGNSNSAYIALGKWADTLVQHAEFERAFEKYQQIVDYSKSQNQIVNGLFALKSMINIDLDYGRFDDARNKLDSFKYQLSAIENAELIASYYQLEITYSLIINDFETAKNTLSQFQSHAESLENPAVQLNYDSLLIDFETRTNSSKINPNIIMSIAEASHDQSQLLLVKAKFYAHNKNNEMALDFFLQSMIQLQSNGQYDALIKSINTFLEYMLKQNITSESVSNWLNRLESLSPPAYPFLKNKALYQSLIGNKTQSIDSLIELKSSSNQWWNPADDILLNQIQN